MKPIGHINAYILAGGKSSRMGTDKGLLRFRGKPMAEHVLAILSNAFESVTIISNSSEYMKFGVPVIRDRIYDTGPIGGIYTGLLHSGSQWNFFTACDMPFQNISVIEKLLESAGYGDCVAAQYDSQPEPLYACYSKSCINTIESMIAEENYKMRSLLSRLNVMTIGFSTIQKNTFLNINTPEEFNLLSDHEQ